MRNSQRSIDLRGGEIDRHIDKKWKKQNTVLFAPSYGVRTWIIALNVRV